MSCCFRSPKHRTRQLVVLTMRKLATRCQSWMYSSESKGQFLQKIWPLCAVLSKYGGRGQTSGRGGTHRKKKKGSKDVDVPFLCIYVTYIFMYAPFTAPHGFLSSVYFQTYYLYFAVLSHRHCSSDICNANLDFICITETWLKNHIANNFVLVSGYNII